jgi:hypothetical protein
MIEKLYTKAVAGGLDMVFSGIIYEYPEGAERKRQDIDAMSKEDIIKDIAAEIRLQCGVVNKFTKRAVLEKVSFPRISYAEDRVISLQTVYYSEKTGYIDEAFYHYRLNPNSLTRDARLQDSRILEYYDAFMLITGFLGEKYGTLDFFEPELSRKINIVKLPFIENKHLRGLRSMSALYPRSGENVFNKALDKDRGDKLALYAAQKNEKLGFLLYDLIALAKKVRDSLHGPSQTGKRRGG